MLEAMNMTQSVIDILLPQQDPNAPPPPEAQKIQAEIQMLQAQIAQMSALATLEAEKNQMSALKMQQDLQESDSRINESVARAWKMQQDALDNMKKLAIVQTKMTSEQQHRGMEIMHKVDNEQAKTMMEAHRIKLDTDLGMSKADVEQARTMIDAHKVKTEKEKKVE
jgi:small-conductance mechanosensitive channel